MDTRARSVMIAFSPADRPAAERLCTGLEARGYHCALRAGGDGAWGTFDATTALVVLVSTNTASDIERDLAAANERGSTVVPVRLDASKPAPALTAALAGRTWVDASRNWDNAVGEIAAQLGAPIASAPVGGAAPIVAPAGAAPQPVIVQAPEPKVVYVPYPVDRPTHGLRNFFATVLVLLLLGVAGAAGYYFLAMKPTRDRIASEFDACNHNGDSGQVIGNCTSLLNEGEMNNNQRALTFDARGKAYLRHKDFAKARADFIQAAQLSPGLAETYYYRSLAERGLGHMDVADALASNAASLGFSPTPEDFALTPTPPASAMPAATGSAHEPAAPEQNPATPSAPETAPSPPDNSTTPVNPPAPDQPPAEPAPAQ